MLKRLSESELDIMLIIWRAPEALDTGEIARRLQKGWKITGTVHQFKLEEIGNGK